MPSIRSRCGLALVILAALAPAASLAAERYVGTLKGQGGRCNDVEFDVTVDGNAITGTGYVSGGSRTAGAATGTRSGQNVTVILQTAKRARDSAGTYTITGQIGAQGMRLSQGGSQSCKRPRSGTLSKR